MHTLVPKFRHKQSFVAARSAAQELRAKLKIVDEPHTGFVLGTGWGDTLALEDAREISFKELPGFNALGDLEGHRRSVVVGRLDGKSVIALRGRVHLNEAPCDPRVYAMTRLQIEMLIHLGVKSLVLTCAAGSLTPRIEVGAVMFIDGFMSLYAPPMPLFVGEFKSPDDVIDIHHTKLASERVNSSMTTKLRSGAQLGGHAMVLGPFFEGRKYDKPALAATGAKTVGMSVLPEACVAALYMEEGVRIVPLAFVTNTASEEHSHEENMKRAKATAGVLGNVLRDINATLSTT